MTSPDVCILMATYNGAAYLDCQLDSIRAQGFQNWELLIRDDGSTDATTEIIDRHCRQDKRIRRIDEVGAGREGPKGNFRILLARALDSTAGLIMFCDQDDYWYPDKVATFLEHAGDTDEPRLLYSDIELADSQLEPLASDYSFSDALHGHNAETLSGLLSLNHIPGCSMAVNRRLAMIASPVPEVAIMHDWWLALAAAAGGKITFIDEKLVKYRQHEDNVVGASSLTRLVLDVGRWPALWRKGSQELCATMQQAGELAKRLDSKTQKDPERLAVLRLYAGIAALGPFARIGAANRLKLRKGRGLLKTVLYLRLLFLSCRR